MKEKLSLLFKILIVIVCGTGIFLNIKLLSLQNSIIYFTIQSNLACFIFYLFIVLLMITKKLKKNNLYYISKGMVTMAITVTMVVYQTLLAPNGDMIAYENHLLECNFVHLYTPILIILDYLIFGEKGNIKKEYPFIWSLSLIAYQLFDFIYVILGGRFANGAKYPYPYMNTEIYGIIGVFINCLIIFIFFVGYGYIVQNIDNFISKKKDNNKWSKFDKI